MRLFKMEDFEMDAMAIKNLMSGTYTKVKKLNVRGLHDSIHIKRFLYHFFFFPGVW